MITTIRTLLVENSARDASLVIEALRWEGYEPVFERVQTPGEMEIALTNKEWDIVLCDHAMPGFDALAAIRLLKKAGLELPVIIVSGTMGEENAVAAMKQGAADYLMKDRLTRLGAAVSHALEQGRLRREQKCTTEALKEEQALFNSLADTIPDHIYFKDRESRFIRINAMLARRFGLQSPKEAVGKTDSDFFAVEHSRQAYQDEQHIMQTGEPIIGCEEKETWPDGRLTWVSSTKMPVRNGDGKITGLVGISRDITDRKQLEEQLRQAQRMEAVGQLSGGVAHDFNNLLTVIKGYIGLLRVRGQIPAETIGFIQQIDQAADRATHLTRQLLMFSRQQVMEQTDHNLNELVANLAKMLHRLLSENIEMVVNCDQRPMMIRADHGMVEQVLLNLMINARDAMPQGGTLTISTAPAEFDATTAKQFVHARPGAFVCMSIADSGTGIAPEILSRIFEPFFTTKGIDKGTGLGLATVYSIMEQHGGWISAESTVGQGSVFRVYFPRLKSMPTSSPADKVVATVRGGREGILLVEDETAVRQIAEAVLSSLGYRVFSAANGPAALKVWQEHKGTIELLMTDLIMPDGVSGRELAVKLREERPSLPIVYVSGYSREVAAADFRMKEGINYLSKPFDLTNLAKIVRTSLDRGATQAPFSTGGS